MTTQTVANEKYIKQRYRLFSRFDQGIRLDRESWYSVTPELIAKHIAQKSYYYDNNPVKGKRRIMIDPFCGVGGNLIQFSHVYDLVIGGDLSADRLEMARHNLLKVYQVPAEKFTLKTGDFLAEETLAAFQSAMSEYCRSSNGYDIDIFLSPPWGGPDYNSANSDDSSHNHYYSVENHLKPSSLSRMLNQCRKLLARLPAMPGPRCSTIVLYLPKNTDINELLRVINATNTAPPATEYRDGDAILFDSVKMELEQNLLGDKLKTICCYLQVFYE